MSGFVILLGQYGRPLVLCFLATICFAGLFHVPGKALPVAAGIGTLGYLVWLLVTYTFHSPMSAFFFATLLLATLSELAARWQKMPATVFVTTAIIPIVPGIGLYQTMLKIVERDYDQAADLGFNTLLAIGLMALALALNTLMVPSLHRMAHRRAD